jgi:hypothetical protein
MATVTNIPVISSSLLAVQSAFQPLFSPQPVHDNFYFDDGPRVPNTKTSVTSSLSGAINTTAIDPFAQGVEITNQARYDAGLAKIWSGDPGHILKKSVFGQDKNFFPGTTFADQDLFDPTQFLVAQEQDSPLWFNILTFPIITRDNDQLENYTFNGIIEPFPIREVVAFFSINVPFEAHTIRANLVGGNENQLNGSDRVLTVDYFDPRHQTIGFLDMVDMIQNHPLNGFYRFEFSPLAPFIDQKLNRNTSANDHLEDAILIDSMDHMSGNTDNYVSYDQRSATCGWSYDNNAAIGTDSLPFGGMTY